MPTPNNNEFDGTEQAASNGETVFGFYFRRLFYSSYIDVRSPRTIIEKIKVQRKSKRFERVIISIVTIFTFEF